MIRLFVGENEFMKRERLRELLGADVEGVERIDGDVLEVGALRELLQGQTLFSAVRTVVISDLSEGPAWSRLPDLDPATDNTVILLEQKVDKRTSTYKWLKKHASVEEFAPIGERESGKVVVWCVQRAKDEHGFVLARPLATALVERLGHDQLRLDKTLEQLSFAEKVDEELLDAVVPLPRAENVFGLFEAVLSGDRTKIHTIMSYLELELGADGAYQTLGLLVSQLVPLNGLVLGGALADVAKDLSAHPFVVQKLSAHARHITPSQIRMMNDALGRADRSMKTTSVSPWLLLEAALVEMTTIVQ